MRKAEFLQELREALSGEVSASVIQENIAYYDSYISGQIASGRSEEAVIDEIGSPRLIAKTIIDSQEAAEGADGIWRETGSTGGSWNTESRSYDTGAYGQEQRPKIHYIDFSKWYWKLLGVLIFAVVIFLGIAIFSGMMTIAATLLLFVIRYAGPLLVIWLIYQLLRGPRR